ncbi:MAG: hypothetical protein L0241_32470 [Planctomycetia bacterium]|nr:hypothetical protein [Planctomycetia bacterium]
MTTMKEKLPAASRRHHAPRDVYFARRLRVGITLRVMCISPAASRRHHAERDDYYEGKTTRRFAAASRGA